MHNLGFYNLWVRKQYGINIYQNSSADVIFIRNKPIKEDEISTFKNEELSVEINPFEYYAHIPTNDEGEIFRAGSDEEIINKIDEIIEERKKSIKLGEIVVMLRDAPYRYQTIDSELERARNILEHNQENTDDIVVYGIIFNDIGVLKDYSTSFVKEDFLQPNSKQVITNRLLDNFRAEFPFHMVERINVKIVECSITEIQSLLCFTESEWLPIDDNFQRRLFSHSISQSGGRKLLFRAEIEGKSTPVIEIHFDLSGKFRYYLVKREEMKNILKSISSE